MTLLLDTHVFLWFITRDVRLHTSWRDSIRDPHNEIYLSAVSLWEAVIKHALGKMHFPEPPGIYLPAQRVRHHIASLPLDEPSVRHLSALPPIHRDPFDRMLVCQAIEHKLTLVTMDEVFQSYPAPILALT
jgi:PIN domain nuclease of toxin-antitoxin system